MIIYKATNLINGKCYIGQSTRELTKRIYEHLYDLKRNNIYFHNALKKYGKENFKWEVIYECDDKLILNFMETFKIIVNHSHKSENGYNITWGGNDRPMNIPEISKKLSKKLKCRIFSDETKKKMSESHKGKTLTEEHKRKISISKLGHITTEETRRKISEIHKGRKVSEETKQKMRKPKKRSKI